MSDSPSPHPSSARRRLGVLPALLLGVPALLILALQALFVLDPRELGELHRLSGGLGDQLYLVLVGLVLLFVLAAALWPPFLPRIRLSLSSLWQRLNADRKAIRDLLGRIEHFAAPRDLTELAGHYNDAGQHKEALVYLKLALENGSEDPRTHYEAARALLELGALPEALNQIERTLQQDPELGFGAARLLAAEIANAGREPERAEAHARASIDSKGPSVLALFWLARALWQQDRKEDARATLRELRELPKAMGRRRDARSDWARARAKLALRTGGRP